MTTFLYAGAFNKQTSVIDDKKKEYDSESDKDSFKKELDSKMAEKIGYKNLLNPFATIKSQFIFAVDQAMLTGKLLAHYLTKSSFADNRAVTMIGFSLGAVVTYNCMKMLKLINDMVDPRAGKFLCDVQTWAGAYVVDVQGQDREKG